MNSGEQPQNFQDMRIGDRPQEASVGPQVVDVREIIDDGPITLYQRALLGICAAVAFVDGYDLQALAVAAPHLSSSIDLQPSQLGLAFAIGSIGGLFGGLLVAPFSDRLGRRAPLLVCLVLTGLATMAYPFVRTGYELLLLRFMGGMFLAASITIVHAYSAEIVPRRFSATAVMITTSGFGIGVSVAGFASGALINNFGWHSIFYVGAMVTGIVLTIVAAALPESVRHLALRANGKTQIRKFLRRLSARDIPDGAAFVLNEERRRGAPLLRVFTEGRLRITVSLCGCFLLLNGVIYVLVQWLPTLLRSTGADVTQAGLALGIFKLAGLVGSFICAAFIDRRPESYRVLIISLSAAAVGLFLLADLASNSIVYLVGIAAVGLFLTGPQYAIAGLAARLYPTYIRVTGLAVTSGAARIGAICGPLLAGVAVEAAWTASDVFRIAALPTALSALIFVLLSALSLGPRAVEGPEKDPARAMK